MALVRRPFKGTFAHEWQIGALVLQVRHSAVPADGSLTPIPVLDRRPSYFLDPYWRR